MERNINHPKLGRPPRTLQNFGSLAQPSFNTNESNIGLNDLSAIQAQLCQLQLNQANGLSINSEAKQNFLKPPISNLFIIDPCSKPLKFNAKSQSCPIAPIPLVLPSQFKKTVNCNKVQALSKPIMKK